MRHKDAKRGAACDSSRSCAVLMVSPLNLINHNIIKPFTFYSLREKISHKSYYSEVFLGVEK